MTKTKIAGWKAELDQDRAAAKVWASEHDAAELMDFQLFLLTDPEYVRGLSDAKIDCIQRLANIGLKQAIIDRFESATETGA